MHVAIRGLNFKDALLQNQKVRADDGTGMYIMDEEKTIDLDISLQ